MTAPIRWNRSVSGAFRTLLAIGFVGLVWGCGVKSPPKPPSVKPPPAVQDLSAKLDGDRVHLSWHLPEWRNGDDALIGTRVYRSQVPAADVCQGCPETYEKRSDVSFQPDDPDNRVQHFSESLVPGFQYRYQVVPHTESGRQSGPSNRVTVTY